MKGAKSNSNYSGSTMGDNPQDPAEEKLLGTIQQNTTNDSSTDHSSDKKVGATRPNKSRSNR